jgi:ATP-binding cassette, subfamily B, bacterial MsbA
MVGKSTFEKILSLFGDISDLARGSRLIVAAFITLSALNALTEGLSIMVAVPILTAISSNSLFEDLPLIGHLAVYFKALEPARQLTFIAVFILTIAVARGFLQYFLDIFTYLMPVNVEHNLKSRAFRAYLRSSVAFSESLSSGELSNYLASYPARSAIAMRFFATMVSSSISISLILVLLAALTPQSIMVIGFFGLISSLIFQRVMGERARIATENLAECQQSFNQTYFEAAHFHRAISAMRSYDFFERRIQKALNQIHRQQIDLFKIQEATFPFFQTAAGAIVAGLLVIAAWTQPDAVPKTIGILIISLVAMTRILGPLSLFHISRMHFTNNVIAVRKMSEFLRRANAELELDGAAAVSGNSHIVRFENVGFSYVSARPVLDGVSFVLNSGEIVAITGPSGSGKSTILSLLLRLFHPQKGKIFIDDINLADLSIQSFAERLGVVSQDFAIFRGSIAQNIALTETADEITTDIETAATHAGVSSFAESMDGGLLSPVKEFGSNLSGGQQQRIAIARAFFHSRGILLLDEPSNQLDAAAESELALALKAYRGKGYAILLVTHSATLTAAADRILVLNHGKIVSAEST